MSYVFNGIVAINPETMLPETNGAGNVYARDDESFTTPLTVQDLTGTPMTTITSSQLGYVTPFRTDNHPQVWWVSGGAGILLTSWDGVLEDAQSAAASALMAQQAADQALADLQTYIATYPGSGRIADDQEIADLIANPDSATRAAIIDVAGEGGPGGGGAAGVFCILQDGAGYPYADYEDATMHGLQPTEVIFFIGTATPPAWAAEHPRGFVHFTG